MVSDSGHKRLQLSKHLDYVIQLGFEGKQAKTKEKEKYNFVRVLGSSTENESTLRII